MTNSANASGGAWIMSLTGSDRPIDPGAEFARPREGKLPFLIEFVERHPACTLAGGEAKLLVDEIRRLEGIIDEAHEHGNL